VQGLVRVRKHPQFGLVQRVVLVGDRVGQEPLGDAVARGRQSGKGVGDNVTARLADSVTPVFVPRRIGP
jgi:hypothetical protein